MKYDKTNNAFYFSEYEMGDPANAIQRQLLTAYFGYSKGEAVLNDYNKLRDFVDTVLMSSAYIEDDNSPDLRLNFIKQRGEPCTYFVNQLNTLKPISKFEQLFNVICTKSAAYKLDWSIGNSEDSFILKSENADMYISKNILRVSEQTVFKFVVVDSNGRTLDELNSINNPDIINQLSSLYSNARYVAMEADAVIDDILTELGGSDE